MNIHLNGIENIICLKHVSLLYVNTVEIGYSSSVKTSSAKFIWSRDVTTKHYTLRNKGSFDAFKEPLGFFG